MRSRAVFDRCRIAAQILLPLLLAMFYVSPALAQRTVTVVDSDHTLPTSSIPRDRVVGSTLPAVVNIVNWSVNAGTACTITKTSTVSGALVPGYTNVYRTSNPGIGIRFGHTQGGSGGWVFAPTSDNIALPAGASSFPLYRGFEPVIVGPVSSGVLSSLPSMTITFAGPCITTKTTTTTITAGTIITAQTCNVLTTSSGVTLPTIPAPQLSPVGTTAGNTNFSINLNCLGGGSANVYATFTDGANSANRSNTLTLSTSSTAQGVMLRILRGGTPISFGADSAVAGNTNQFLIGAASSTSSMNFTAQYISTGSVVPGTVNATATFTMSYQ